jgi:ectoine hydroxylase-related dioxygenase (phytanoyl-CoA dioxygenase family)
MRHVNRDDSTVVDPVQLDRFWEEGFCVVPSVIEATVVDRARRASVAASEAAAADGYPTVMEALDPGGRNVRSPDLLPYDLIFAEMAVHPVVVGYVKALLTDDWLFSNFTGNNALPGSGSMNPHNDQSTLMPEPWDQLWCLNVIWCLDDVDEGNGATRYLPGSQRHTRFSEVPPNPRLGMRSFEAPAGSVIVMDGRMWHTSGANTSTDRERMMLFALYARAFLRLQANWWQVLPAEVQRSLPEELRLRLGLLWPNRGYGSYLVSTNPQPTLGS